MTDFSCQLVRMLRGHADVRHKGKTVPGQKKEPLFRPKVTSRSIHVKVHHSRDRRLPQDRLDEEEEEPGKREEEFSRKSFQDWARGHGPSQHLFRSWSSGVRGGVARRNCEIIVTWRIECDEGGVDENCLRLYRHSLARGTT